MCFLRGTDWIFICNSTFCPHSVFMCFVWIWEQTAIISLYSINWLVFITETQCAYCAVRTRSLHVFHMNSQLQKVSARVYKERSKHWRSRNVSIRSNDVSRNTGLHNGLWTWCQQIISRLQLQFTTFHQFLTARPATVSPRVISPVETQRWVLSNCGMAILTRISQEATRNWIRGSKVKSV